MRIVKHFAKCSNQYITKLPRVCHRSGTITTDMHHCVNCSSSAYVQDKKLFTPGPLNVSQSVKQAMLYDLGSRDKTFIETVQYIRDKLLAVAEVTSDKYCAVPLQGSGTYAVEAVLSTTIPRTGGKVLILENGAYGKRIASICKVLDIPHHVLSFPEDQRVDVDKVVQTLQSQADFSTVAIIHCETSSGVFNPVIEVGAAVKQNAPNAHYFVDAMSSFGAVPLNLEQANIDFLVSSANKCIQGVPGFSFVIANKKELMSAQGWARSLSLDLVAQHQGLETNGQFRFTPPTHAMLAFKQALVELEKEGGVAARSRRYKQNREVLRHGMCALGFEEFLDDTHAGYVITSYRFPDDPKFDFRQFYERLSAKDQVIYPGKVLNADCFRIGNIGHLFPEDMVHLMRCIKQVCADMGMSIPQTSATAREVKA